MYLDKELLSLFEWEPWIPEVFQLVLVGQPELDTLMDDALMRYRPKVPGQRVKISPLSEKESLEYMAHRLRIAGSSSAAVFSPQALSLIAKYAHGIPRVINIVCDNAFLAGYSESLKRIEVGVIREIIGNLDGPGVKRKMRGRIFGAKASFRPLSLRTSRFGLIVLAGLAVGVFLYLAGPDLANRMTPSKGPGEIKKSAELKEETLLAQAPDKTIRVHLGTFSSLNKATLFKNSLILRGNRIAVQPKKVSPRVTWYRVEAIDYRTENEALADIRMLRGKGLLPFF